MDTGMALDLGRQALMTALIIAMPMLCVGLVVGVLISIMQAVTQVQEMTLTFVPKIIAMILAAAFFMPWILNRMMNFAAEMFSPMVVP
ncbi:MAG: flagellar biosynthetic protein FliQ [Phycisphaerae bacterium SM23_30]|nr:MAG: flagellar biosynthetic protein FliQ [Phycisphaerae bacterium SM23_30]